MFRMIYSRINMYVVRTSVDGAGIHGGNRQQYAWSKWLWNGDRR